MSCSGSGRGGGAWTSSLGRQSRGGGVLRGGPAYEGGASAGRSGAGGRPGVGPALSGGRRQGRSSSPRMSPVTATDVTLRGVDRYLSDDEREVPFEDEERPP